MASLRGRGVSEGQIWFSACVNDLGLVPSGSETEAMLPPSTHRESPGGIQVRASPTPIFTDLCDYATRDPLGV